MFSYGLVHRQTPHSRLKELLVREIVFGLHAMSYCRRVLWGNNSNKFPCIKGCAPTPPTASPKLKWFLHRFLCTTLHRMLSFEPIFSLHLLPDFRFFLFFLKQHKAPNVLCFHDLKRSVLSPKKLNLTEFQTKVKTIFNLCPTNSILIS